MERFALAALLSIGVPSLAFSQYFEIAALGGAYQPIPRLTPYVYECADRPDSCWGMQATRGVGTVIGWRLSRHITPRFGVDVTVQRMRAINRWSISPFLESRVVAATFVALQPHVRVRLDDFIEVSLAVGPAVVVGDAHRYLASPSTTPKGALAFAGALRAHISRLYTLELRASDTHLLGRETSYYAPVNRNHLIYGLGMAFAFKR